MNKKLMALMPLSMSLLSQSGFDYSDLDMTEDTQRFINGGLTDQEIEDGYFIDPVLGKCNISKAFDDKSDAIRREYEIFDLMHEQDGTLSKSVLKL